MYGMRLFVAIDLDREAKGKIANIIDQLKSRDFDVKWVEPESMHLTLKFLGEVHENQVSGIEERISRILEGVKKFKISISKVGYFGSPGYIRVIWVDVIEGKERLIELSKLFNKELSYIRREDYEPSPHLTIGRVKSGRNREKLVKEIERLKHVNICEVDVNEIKLKRSILDKEGPIYSDLKVFELE